MTEFKVGLLALMTILATVIMSLKITSNQSGFGEYASYSAKLSDATGIFPKTPIKVAGIAAGRIKKIELEGQKAKISFEVLSKVQIPKDSQLRVKTVGLLGDKFLEIQLGQSSETLLVGSEFPVFEGGSMESIISSSQELVDDLKTVVGYLKKSLGPQGKNEQSMLDEIVADIKKITHNTAMATEKIETFLDKNTLPLSQSIQSLKELTEQLARETDAAYSDSTVAELKEVLRNAKVATANLNDIILHVKQGKGTLGKLIVEEEIAEEVRQTLSSVKKVVNRVNAVRTEIAVFSGVNSVDGGNMEASLKIFPSPERFYLLGVNSSKFGPLDKKEIRHITNGKETLVEEEQRKKDSFLFSAQLGRNIHNWTFRGGLLESSGGVGLDYTFYPEGVSFSTEVFNYRKNEGMNLRVFTGIHLWNVFHAKLGGDDLLLSKNRAYFVQVGLRFTDEDLKGLLGFIF